MGRMFEHHWGPTLRQSESALFASLAMQFNPLYFNLQYARALDYANTPVCPSHVFSVVQILAVGRHRGRFGIDPHVRRHAVQGRPDRHVRPTARTLA